MLKRRRRQKYAPTEGGRFIGAFMTQLRLPVPRALLSMFRNGALGPQLDAYRALAAHDVPALVLRGSEDPILSRAQVALLRTSVRARYAMKSPTPPMASSSPIPNAARPSFSTSSPVANRLPCLQTVIQRSSKVNSLSAE